MVRIAFVIRLYAFVNVHFCDVMITHSEAICVCRHTGCQTVGYNKSEL